MVLDDVAALAALPCAAAGRAAGSVRPGRPRDPDREEAILAAALELVTELGYDRVSIEAIATRARASKATVYRRWPGKAQLVADALRARKQSLPVPRDTGDLRRDLVEGISAAATELLTEHAGLLVGMVTAMSADPELAALVREQTIACRREASLHWLGRAVERGQIRPDVDIDMIADLVPATVVMRVLVTGEPVDVPFVERFVDGVLLPLLGWSGPESVPSEVSPADVPPTAVPSADVPPSDVPPSDVVPPVVTPSVRPGAGSAADPTRPAVAAR